jgi:hypothetical protein
MKNIVDKMPSVEGKFKLDLKDGFTFSPKNDSETIITIYDEELLNNCIDHKFNNKYKKLLAIIINILQSDDSTDSDFEIALGEVEKQRSIVLKKYEKYLEKKKTTEYLKKLEYLEKELKKKYYLKEQIYINENQESMHR